MNLLKQKKTRILISLAIFLLIMSISNLVLATTGDEVLTYENLKYVVDENNEIIITGADENATTIDIPEEIDGKKVTRIGGPGTSHQAALSSLPNVTSITIPDTVVEIGVDAFTYDSSLEELIIPDSVTTIGDSFAVNCTSLKKITLSNNITELGMDALAGCSSLEEVTIPDSITSIGWYAFWKCTSLRKAVVPSTVTEIEEGAFTYCDNLTIYCYKDSKIAEYAISNNIKYIYLDYLPYTDLESEDKWWCEAIEYCYLNNLMTGYTNTTSFGPRNNVLRGQVILIIYRMEEEPEITTESQYSDVQDAEAYYYDAVVWATEKEIVTGYEGTGEFKPTNSITRQEFAIMLYRYAKYKGMDVTETASLSGFADNAKVSSWAQTEMKWAVGVGIISGIESSNGNVVNISPKGNATRAQVATMIMRYCEL